MIGPLPLAVSCCRPGRAGPSDADLPAWLTFLFDLGLPMPLPIGVGTHLLPRCAAPVAG